MSTIANADDARIALADVMKSERFRDRFPGAHLIKSVQDTTLVCAQLPPTLQPFMVEMQPGGVDIYAFDQQNGNRVVVWNDHAVVADWSTFEIFFDWLSGNTPYA